MANDDARQLSEMIMSVKLTATQTIVLNSAAARPDGNIEPLPSNLRGGAKTAVIDGLLARALITKSQHSGHVEYCLTDAAYTAVGRKRKVPAPVTPDAETEAAVAAAEATWVREKRPPAESPLKDSIERKLRPGTKILTLVELLKEPGGASIVTLLQATGWLPHTIRGAISAIVKKKLGFSVISDKGLSGERIYKIDITAPKS